MKIIGNLAKLIVIKKKNKAIISDKHSRKFIKFDKNKKKSVRLRVWGK